MVSDDLVFCQSPNSGFIEIESVLRFLANVFLDAQHTLEGRSRDLADEFPALTGEGFSLDDNGVIRISDNTNGEIRTARFPLLSLVSFRSHKISELLVDFAVTAEDHCPISAGQTWFRVVSPDSKITRILPARIKITGNENLFAEFQIAGETKVVMVLRRD